MNNAVRIAVSAALSGPPRRCRHGAVIVKGNRIISAGFNSSTKTHSGVLKWFKYAIPHAEMHAALKAGFDSCYRADLVVVRLMADGSIGHSKPCFKCVRMAEDLQLRRVWYTTKDGALVML